MIEKLLKALKDNFDLAEGMGRLDQLLKKLQPVEAPKKLSIKTANSTHLIPLQEILYFQSEHKYTNVITESRSFVVDESLVSLEQKLEPDQFLKIHRSAIVNVEQISEIRKSASNKTCIVLNDDASTQLPVGRSYLESVKQLCKNLVH